MRDDQAGSIAESLHFIDRTLRALLELQENPLLTTTHRRVRNEAAVCGNCPYYKPNSVGDLGACCVTSEYPSMYNYQWCGQHPDFWKETA